MALDKSNVNRCVSMALLSLLAVFALVVLLHLATMVFGPSKTSCTKQVCLTKFLEGPPAFNNEAMAKYLRANFFHSPTTSDYHLSGHDGASRSFDSLVQFIKEYFKNKHNGVFVDLGAGDGEYRSLTLPLERSLGWSGLLIEPNPRLAQKLLAKGRKAQLVQACVSPYSYPAKMKMSYPRVSEGLGEAAEVEQMGLAKLEMLWPKETANEREGIEAQCVPLENLVYSAGITSTIDLLVLDMSGTDLDILLSTKLDQIPEMEMIVINSNGADISTDVSGYFLERNMVIKKVFGEKAGEASYVLIKFDAHRDL